MFTRITEQLELEVDVLSSSPWVVLIRNLVREDELQVLRAERDYHRASDTGKVGPDGRATKVDPPGLELGSSWDRMGI